MTAVLIMDASPAPPPAALATPARCRGGAWTWAVVALAAVTFALTAMGVGESMSEYYASIALSMSRSWTNFFFGAVDPAGTLARDEIPGSFWITTLSARLFGFPPLGDQHPRCAGRDRRRPHHGVFMAAGFQTYMLESWAVWPALAAAYLCIRHPWLRKISHLTLAGAVSLALSLGWIIVVALIPTSHRSFIGSVGSIGGFNGGDAVPTLTAFEKLVDGGALRYVLVSGSTGAAGSSRGGGFGSTGTGSTGTGNTGALAGGSPGGSSSADTSSAQIRTWVLANCTAVSDSTATGIYERGG